MKIEDIQRVHTDKQAEHLLLPPDTVHLPTAHLLKPDQAPQRIFGIFVEIAGSIIEAYHSDLYYDADTLRKKDWENELTLWYTVGKCGTYLLDSLADAEMHRTKGRPHVYQVLYRRSEFREEQFTLTIKKIYSPEDE